MSVDAHVLRDDERLLFETNLHLVFLLPIKEH